MAATVRHNMGTVEEHIALCCTTDWACEFSKEAGPLRYVDTHTMAPLNRPVGNDFPALVQALSDLSRAGIPALAQNGTRSYFESIRRATLLVRDRGVEEWYPTHFLHAWAVARTHGVPFDTLLFENDGEGDGRRACLSRFLVITNLLLCDQASAFTGSLAAEPGDFRAEVSWPTSGVRRGRALILMNDPFQVEDQARGDSYMDFQDVELLANRLGQRYLERPALTVNVIFCFSNPGVGNRYQTLTQALTQTWAGEFANGGEYRSVGIKWGSFMVFVAACNTGEPWAKPTFAEAFATLEDRIRAGLNLAYHSQVELYRAKTPPRTSARLELISARNEADAVIYELEKVLKEHEAKIGASEKEAVRSAIERTKQAASKDDAAAIRQAVSDLKAAAQSLAQYVQGGAGGPGGGPGAGPSAGGGEQGGGKGGPDDVIDAEFEVKK